MNRLSCNLVPVLIGLLAMAGCTTTGPVGAQAPPEALTDAETFIQATNVQQIQETSVPDMPVRVTGEVTERIDGNEYRFNDGSGTIRIEGGPPWHHNVDLPLNMPLHIVAKIDTSPPHAQRSVAPSLEMVAVVLNDGHRIDVRPMQGPPPWAGPPDRRSRSGRGERSGSPLRDAALR